MRALKFLFAGVLTAGAVSVLGGWAGREDIKPKAAGLLWVGRDLHGGWQ